MEAQHFDFIVIGGGSAGYAAARTARETHNRVAIVDGAAELGGLCILKGCMPSKTLIYSAEVLHLAQKGRTFGLDIPEARADLPSLHARKLVTIEEFAAYRRSQLEAERFTLFRDFATFIDPQTIELRAGGERLTADHFLIATGSTVQTPPIPGLAETPHWTSDDVLDLDHLPESVIVLGGGIVACELAQFLRRIGSRVIQIQRSPLILKEISPEAAAVVMQAFRAEGIELFTDTQLTQIYRTDDGVAVTFQQKSVTHTVRAARLLNALGRKPATANLGLAAAGISTLPSGHIAVNSFQQTENPRVYAAGDVAGPHEIVHLAILQGEVAARHARGETVTPVDYDIRTGVVFTDPQVATVGLSPSEAAERGLDVIAADYPFDDHGKSILMEAKYGYVKAWADRATGRLIGAECVGKDAGELIHAMAVAVTLRADVRDLLRVHWYHPTLSEIWSYPLEDLVDALPTATE